jgi:hypothetical protein
VTDREEENCRRDIWAIDGDAAAPRTAVNLANRLIAWFKESPCDAMMGEISGRWEATVKEGTTVTDSGKQRGLFR